MHMVTLGAAWSSVVVRGRQTGFSNKKLCFRATRLTKSDREMGVGKMISLVLIRNLYGTRLETSNKFGIYTEDSTEVTEEMNGPCKCFVSAFSIQPYNIFKCKKF